MQAYECRSQYNKTALSSYSDIYWIDAGVPLEKYIGLKPYQVYINVYSCVVNPV